MGTPATRRRVREAIPTPVRVTGYLVLTAPTLAALAGRPGRGRQIAWTISERLKLLGLGSGIEPLAFLTFAWVAVALMFWGHARSRGEGLGRKSGAVVLAAVAAQLMLVVLLRLA